MIINNIKSVVHNWRQVEGGEDYDLYKVGEYGVQRIDYIEELKCCRVQCTNHNDILLFNINRINYISK